MLWERAACRSTATGPRDSRGPSGRGSLGLPIYPGHRPSASALGWALPARWAGLADAPGVLYRKSSGAGHSEQPVFGWR